MEQDKHRWKIVPVPDKYKDTFNKWWECTRGDCKCIKMRSTHYINKTSYHNYIYERSGMMYDDVPECYGNTPINEQGID